MVPAPEQPEDFRSQRMQSPDGKGLARRAWDAYAGTVAKVVASPPIQPAIQRYGAATAVDLFGFWLVWHLEGGFEGLRRSGMSRSAIYRRLRLFRKLFGAHPDEFEMPGVTIDLAAFQEGKIRL
jgi:hypothetical protein